MEAAERGVAHTAVDDGDAFAAKQRSLLVGVAADDAGQWR